jgi:hypothetical protein
MPLKCRLYCDVFRFFPCRQGSETDASTTHLAKRTQFSTNVDAKKPAKESAMSLQQRRPRPSSAPSRKRGNNKTADPSGEPAPLGYYSKSLALLGVNVPSSRVEATKLTSQAVKVYGMDTK